MATAAGIVEVVSEKGGIHSLKLNDGKWYGFFKTLPACEKGDNVTFQFETKGTFLNAKAGSLIVEKTPQKQKSEAGATTTVMKAGSDVRQDSIVWQSARNAAIELVGVMVQAEAVKLPAKQADRYSAMMALVGELTLQFVEEAKALSLKDSAVMASAPSKFDEEA